MSAPRTALRRADHELQAARPEAFGDELREPRFQDRHLALAQPGDSFRVEIGADDVVAQMSEAGRRREPDVSRADDRDLHAEILMRTGL